MKRKIALPLLLASSLLLTALSGCGQQKAQTQTDLSGVEAMTENTLPITQEDITLSTWMVNNAQGYLKSYNDAKDFSIIKEKTGVGFDFQHPTGSAGEQLNIILASKSYPDIIYSNWTQNGPKVLKDGIALRLNEYIDKYAPNIKKYLEENPEIKKQITLASGDIIMIPNVVDDQRFLCYDGYFIRQDWLDKVGKTVPTTIDEWYDVLTAFKNNDMNGNGDTSDERPFATFSYTANKEVFVSAYGTKMDFYKNPSTGKMTHGVLEPEFKEYVVEMNKWFQEGLLDPNYLTTAGKELDSMMLNDELGAIYCDNNNSIPKYQQLREDINLVPVPYPKKDEQGKSYYPNDFVIRRARGEGAVITSSCENVVEAVRVLDWLFTQEGSDLMNWGVEGESYTVNADGKKQFTDKILHNPEGKIPHEAICEYMTNTGFAGIIQNEAAQGLESGLDDHIKATRNQSIQYALDADKSMLTWTLPFTVEESEQLANINADLKTYISETVNKFIMGLEPLENYDSFVETAKSMGLEEAVQIYQTAYDRLMNE